MYVFLNHFVNVTLKMLTLVVTSDQTVPHTVYSVFNVFELIFWDHRTLVHTFKSTLPRCLRTFSIRWVLTHLGLIWILLRETSQTDLILKWDVTQNYKKTHFFSNMFAGTWRIKCSFCLFYMNVNVSWFGSCLHLCRCLFLDVSEMGSEAQKFRYWTGQW